MSKKRKILLHVLVSSALGLSFLATIFMTIFIVARLYSTLSVCGWIVVLPLYMEMMTLNPYPTLIVLLVLGGLFASMLALSIAKKTYAGIYWSISTLHTILFTYPALLCAIFFFIEMNEYSDQIDIAVVMPYLIVGIILSSLVLLTVAVYYVLFMIFINKKQKKNADTVEDKKQVDTLSENKNV